MPRRLPGSAADLENCVVIREVRGGGDIIEKSPG